MRGIVLDLFSGTGSATQPFVDCGKHRVVRVDLVGNPDVRADVARLPIRFDTPIEFVWASPPCTEFSTLTNLRKRWPGKTGPNPKIGMELVTSAAHWCGYAESYCLENVYGSIPYISKVLGRPSLNWCGRVLWSNLEFPPLMNPPDPKWRKGGRRPSKREPEKREAYLSKLKAFGFPDSFKGHSAMRSMIPKPLAEMVHRSVCDLALRPKGEGG